MSVGASASALTTYEPERNGHNVPVQRWLKASGGDPFHSAIRWPVEGLVSMSEPAGGPVSVVFAKYSVDRPSGIGSSRLTAPSASTASVEETRAVLSHDEILRAACK
jgi:hypothetical protein